MSAGMMQLILEPESCPRRTREACIRDLAALWGRPDLHLTALAGWKANMIVNALDGSEDHLASTEIREFWEELEMSKVREQIIEEVCSECEAGRLEWSFEVVYGVIEAFETTGFLDFYEEGQEDEGDATVEAELGERPWRDTDGPSDAEEDAVVPETRLQAAAPPLTEAQAQESQRHASRLRALADAEAVAPCDARLAKAFAEVRRTMLKESSGRNQADAAIASAVRDRADLRRDAVSQLHEELKRRRVERQAQTRALQACFESLDKKAEALQREQIALASAGHRAEEQEALAKRQRELQAIAYGFTTNELGQGQPAGGAERFRRARADLLRMVANLGQALPAHIEARWTQWVRRWDMQGVRQHDRAWAMVVRDEMSEVVNRLNGGDRMAFINWHTRWTRRWGLDLDDISVPGKPVSTE